MNTELRKKTYSGRSSSASATGLLPIVEIDAELPGRQRRFLGKPGGRKGEHFGGAFQAGDEHDVDRHQMEKDAEAKDRHDAPPGNADSPLLATDRW